MSTDDERGSADSSSADGESQDRATDTARHQATDTAEIAAAAVKEEEREDKDAEREVPLRPVVAPRPSNRSFWTRIDRPFVFGFLVTLGGLAALVLGFAVTNLSTVIIYIALALFAALGLDPAVRFLERRGLPRGASVAVTLGSLVLVLGLIIWAVVPVIIEQIGHFVEGVPDMVAEFQKSDLYVTLQNQFGEDFAGLVEDVQNFLSDPGNLLAISGGAWQVGTSVVNAVSGTIIVIVLIIYFVTTLPGMKRAMLRLAPARDREAAAIITEDITDAVGGYVMGMVVLAFMNAVVTLILYLVLGLPSPLLLAVTAFLITLIPLVGPLLFLAIGTGIALFGDSIVLAIIFGAVYLIYIQIEAYVLTPKVMNRAVSIPGSLVVIGALVGGTLLGLLGALVAVPVAASILIIVNKVWIPRQDAKN